MFGITRLMGELSGLGHEVEGPLVSNGQQWVIVRKFTIPGGRFAGQVVSVAIAAPPDYPLTPPGGLYVCPPIVPQADMARLHVHDRADETAELPGTWQYFSRPLPAWHGSHLTRRIVCHWNTVLIIDVKA